MPRKHSNSKGINFESEEANTRRLRKLMQEAQVGNKNIRVHKQKK